MSQAEQKRAPIDRFVRSDSYFPKPLGRLQHALELLKVLAQPGGRGDVVKIGQSYLRKQRAKSTPPPDASNGGGVHWSNVLDRALERVDDLTDEITIELNDGPFTRWKCPGEHCGRFRPAADVYCGHCGTRNPARPPNNT